MARTEYDHVTINVPGSTANLGPYFDRAGAAIPLYLSVRVERTSGKEVELAPVVSAASTPEGRKRGYSGAKALDQYRKSIGYEGGLRLKYADSNLQGFPTGGTGLSGAEAGSAVIAGAILLGDAPSEEQVILAGAKGEPNEHLDNVAPSVMGGIVFISDIPHSSETLFLRVTPPKDLGLAIGFSSFQKTQGTEGTRGMLANTIPKDMLVTQVGRGVGGALSLEKGNVDNFLNLVSGDLFHEPQRAAQGAYGNFGNGELRELKRGLHENHAIALAVSGAGPNMQLWYNKTRYPEGISEEAKFDITNWFEKYDINLTVKNIFIPEQGAYARAQAAYPKSALAGVR